MYPKKRCFFTLFIIFVCSHTYMINSQNSNSLDFALFFEEETSDTSSAIETVDIKGVEDDVQNLFIEDLDDQQNITYSLQDKVYFAYLMGKYKITQLGSWGYNQIRSIMSGIIKKIY